MFNNFLSAQQQGTVYALVSGICYSLAGYFGISLIDFNLSVPNMLFWRFLVAATILMVVMLPRYYTLPKIHKSDLKMLLCGIVFYGLSAIAFFLAARRIGTSVTTSILFAYPVFVILFNALLCRIRIKQSYYIVFFVLLAGITCLGSAHGFTGDLFGLGFAMLSAFCEACYILAGKKSTSKPLMAALMTSIGCAITCLVAACVDGSFYVPTDLSVWCNILTIAIICTIVPLLLFLQALKHIDAEIASVLSASELVFIVIFGIILLHESFNSMQIIGISMVMIGTLVPLARYRRLAIAKG